MENQDSSLGKEIKETVQELKEIYEELEKKGSQVKEKGANIIAELKIDIKNIKQHFDNIKDDCFKQEKDNLSDSSLADKVQSLLGEIKPFLEKLINDISTPQVEIADVFDISSLKFKLAAIYARIYIKKKTSEIIDKVTSKFED